MTESEKNYHKPKHETLCWECEWAGGKNGKCPWACKFEPVPGWNAKPTKVKLSLGKYIDSFDVYECPLFELMTEIKQGIVDNAGKVKRNWNISKEEKEEVKRLRFDECLKVSEIAEKTGLCEKQIYYFLRRIKEYKRYGKEI